ncbi:hypothetical protein [Vibrio owensii]|uniref:hypothetical protein n=1 Tax=Vibrio harveyi group TaxID=717610 RepID=UPI003CC68998
MSNLTHSEKKLFTLIKSRSTNRFVQAYETGQFINKFCSNAFGDSLLGYAIQSNAVKIAEYLAADPELINFAGSNGKPPSVYFKKNVDEAFLVNMVSHGLDLNAKDNTNSTLLHQLARMGSGSDFQTVVENGADIYANNSLNEIPMDTAKRWHNKNVLDLNL